MGKSFIILPFISSIFMFLGALVTIASFPCPWAFANVSNADVKYSFYLLSWTTDACTNSDGSRYRYSYGDSYEFQDLKSSGIVALVVLLIGVVFAWLAQDSPNPYIGFYLELVSIILLAVSILVAMFWKSA
ncbi:Transmembrane protein [Entamoeba marina]